MDPYGNSVPRCPDQDRPAVNDQQHFARESQNSLTAFADQTIDELVELRSAEFNRLIRFQIFFSSKHATVDPTVISLEESTIRDLLNVGDLDPLHVLSHVGIGAI